jgi:hypothetical protein
VARGHDNAKRIIAADRSEPWRTGLKCSRHRRVRRLQGLRSPTGLVSLRTPPQQLRLRHRGRDKSLTSRWGNLLDCEPGHTTRRSQSRPLRIQQHSWQRCTDCGRCEWHSHQTGRLALFRRLGLVDLAVLDRPSCLVARPAPAHRPVPTDQAHPSGLARFVRTHRPKPLSRTSRSSTQFASL